MTKENSRHKNFRRRSKPKTTAGYPPTVIEGGLPIPDDKSILVFAIGGVGQIGMNWTAYGYNGEWVLVDAGSAFAPRDLDVVDAIYPDPAVLSSIIPRLRGLVITHAHEDHIGAVHRLWPELKCPIYATPFAVKALTHRFEERKTDRQVKIKQFTPGNGITVGPFNIQTIQMTHSIPECVALAFKTPVGTILHTGDWKFDPTPLIGEPTNIRALRRLGNAGVLAMVSDSTNAQRPGKITTEADVRKGFKAAFKETRGMVVVTCFATNVARVASAMKAAQETNRIVGIGGLSMLRHVEAARELGMLEGIPEPLKYARFLKNYDRNRMTLLVTGAQGEANASLSKLSVGDDWKLPDLQPGDRVIHSARVIPGNEEEVYGVFDRLRSKGAEILEGEYNGLPLHVTGHATSGEIAEMYDLVRPRFSIPVHGEPQHLEAHAQIALSKGVEKVITPMSGGMYSVGPEGVSKVAQVEIKLQAELAVEARTKIPWNEERIREILSTVVYEPAEYEYTRRELNAFEAPALAVGM